MSVGVREVPNKKAPNDQVADGDGPFTLSFANITSFSPFSVGSTGSILPLTQHSFSGKAIAAGVVLQCKTENDLNFSYFDIQRSTDGANYVTIGKVNASKSAGINEYSFTDPLTRSSATYYRLKQVDIDGKFTYSQVLALTGDMRMDALLVYPNPVINNANLTVRLSHAANAGFSLYDNSGTLIRKWMQNLPAGSTAMIINMDGLAAGVYQLELRQPDSHQSIRLIKK